jgi:hypothetical protein
MSGAVIATGLIVFGLGVVVAGVIAAIMIWGTR